MAEITGNDIQNMVTHWLKTPVYGYLGSDYGSDIKALLQNPHGAGLADAFIDKMRTDLPVLRLLPAGSINLYFRDHGPDKRELIVDVAGMSVSVGG